MKLEKYLQIGFPSVQNLHAFFFYSLCTNTFIHTLQFLGSNQIIELFCTRNYTVICFILRSFPFCSNSFQLLLPYSVFLHPGCLHHLIAVSSLSSCTPSLIRRRSKNQRGSLVHTVWACAASQVFLGNLKTTEYVSVLHDCISVDHQSYSQTAFFVPTGKWVWSTAYPIFVQVRWNVFFSNFMLDVIKDCIPNCVPMIY